MTTFMHHRQGCIGVLLLLAFVNSAKCGALLSASRTERDVALVVQREYNSPDVVTVDNYSNCSDVMCESRFGQGVKVYNSDKETSSADSNATLNTIAIKCRCRCPKTAPVYLMDKAKCVSRLEDCKKPIPFHSSMGMAKDVSVWTPTFFLPLQGNLLAPGNQIKWAVGGVKIWANGSINCEMSKTEVLTENGWQPIEERKLFRLSGANGGTYLKWLGDSNAQRRLLGSLVRIRMKCDGSAMADYCLAFRIHGDNTMDSAYNKGQERPKATKSVQFGEHVELIVAISCVVLLLLTVVGSISLWILCWRYQKDKLSRKIHMQLLYQCAQQGVGIYHTNQAFHYASGPGGMPIGDAMINQEIDIHQPESQHPQTWMHPQTGQMMMMANGQAGPISVDTADMSPAQQQQLQLQQQHRQQLHPPPPYAQPPNQGKRRLYFSPEFFEPELMAEPPQLAEEFLYEVRRMIDIAKNRIRARRHTPTMGAINEERESERSSSRSVSGSLSSEPGTSADKTNHNNNNNNNNNKPTRNCHAEDPLDDQRTQEELVEMAIMCEREGGSSESPKSNKSADSGRGASGSPPSPATVTEPSNIRVKDWLARLSAENDHTTLSPQTKPSSPHTNNIIIPPQPAFPKDASKSAFYRPPSQQQQQPFLRNNNVYPVIYPPDNDHLKKSVHKPMQARSKLVIQQPANVEDAN